MTQLLDGDVLADNSHWIICVWYFVSAMVPLMSNSGCSNRSQSQLRMTMFFLHVKKTGTKPPNEQVHDGETDMIIVNKTETLPPASFSCRSNVHGSVNTATCELHS